MKCGDPGAVSNARKTGNSFSYNSVVTYTCNPGYRISGSERRVCQGDGTWSGVPPKCSRTFQTNEITICTMCPFNVSQCFNRERYWSIVII